MDELVNLAQRCIQNDCIRRFRNGFAGASQGNPDSSCKHRGSIIDAITDKQRFVMTSLLPDECQLLFRTLAEIRFINSHQRGDMSYFAFFISRKQDEPLGPMLRSKVLHKGLAFAFQFVCKRQLGGKFTIHKNQALESVCAGKQRWKGAIENFSFFSSCDVNNMSFDRAPQTIA